MKTLLKLSPSLVVTTFIGVLIIILPLVVNRSILPLGWELPKVYLFQIFMICLILCTLVFIFITCLRKRPKIKVNPYVAGLLLLTIIIIIISTILSPYTRSFQADYINNPIYRIILSNSDSLEKLSVFGNQFRDFGIITVVLIISLLLISKKHINSSTWGVIAFAFIISAAVQSIIGSWQFIELIRVDILSPFTGKWITGTFGQANFYSGHLLMGLVFSLYLLKNSSRRIPILLITLLIIIGILVSFSIGAYIVMIGIIGIVIAYEILPYRTFKLSAFIIGSIAIIATIVISVFSIMQIPPQNYRAVVWKNVIESYIITPASNLNESSNVQKLLFGTGFDTLGENMIEEGHLEGNYVDRAHNFFLDIVTTTGLSGLILFLLFLALLGIAVQRGTPTPIVIYTGIAAIAWLSRSYIHTNSIVNITDFIILLGILAGFSFNTSVSTTSDRTR